MSGFNENPYLQFKGCLLPGEHRSSIRLHCYDHGCFKAFFRHIKCKVELHSSVLAKYVDLTRSLSTSENPPRLSKLLGSHAWRNRSTIYV